ncbi:MAG TPA: hypothetical protein VG937_12385 [Polyangiaceae bacterium]|nr:hypothetical protein [Polyangiaceae bacterium]
MSCETRRLGSGLALVAVTLALSACGPSEARRSSEPVVPPEPSVNSLGPELNVDVSVDPSTPGSTVAATGFGVHGSVYDNALHDPSTPTLLSEAGVRLVRWPGGGYSDNYHFATHTLTPFKDGNPGYLAARTDFGNFVRALESFDAQAMITVNYGSNPNGNGPGEPLEAAAWVAYANGDPGSEQVLGRDSTGFDWQTVGYWASLRASEPLAQDDGKNFLRIAHPDPLGIRYWEIGNELFGNGYYMGEFELDWHVPYDGSKRLGHPNLSPTTYGRGVVSYAREMKAVDASIQIGAVLNTPPMDYSWGPYWNRDVLKEAGDTADFLIVHWYPSGSRGDLLDAPRKQLPAMMKELTKALSVCCPERASAPGVAVTEMGPNSGTAIDSAHAQAIGLFAANGYASLLEHGVFNIDWLELHNGSFISERSQRLGPGYKGVQLASRLVQSGDTFVSSSSSAPYALQTHAALRSDGSLALMLVNIAPATVATVTLNVEPAFASGRAERYDYRPSGEAADGQVVGPSEVPVSSSIVVDAYSAAVLVFYPE